MVAVLGMGALVLVAAPALAADPRIVVKSARVGEGDAGTSTVRVVLRLSRRARAGAMVRFRTRAGSAGASDFISRSGRVRFRRGSRGGRIVLRVRGDLVDESDESFSLRLTRARRLRLPRARAVKITIVDDDSPIVATIGDASVTEPAAPGALASHGLAIALSRAAPTDVRVDYEIRSASATAADLDVVRGTTTFAPGETQKAIPGEVRGDDLDEATETATVLLGNPVGVGLGDSQATLSITDDPGDLPPSIAIADTTVTEGSGSAPLPVTLSAPSGRPVSVAYLTRDGTADAADHQAVAGRLTFEPGATSAEVTVPISDDPRDEDAQAFVVALSEPDSASIADAEASVTIDDDDAAPTFSIADATILEANAAARFTVSLSAPSEKPISLRANTVGATATGGASCFGSVDYVSLVNVEIDIAPGDGARAFDVAVCEDTNEENTETATVHLSNAVNAAPDDPSALLTILDEDP